VSCSLECKYAEIACQFCSLVLRKSCTANLHEQFLHAQSLSGMRNFLSPRVSNRGHICRSGILNFLAYASVLSGLSYLSAGFLPSKTVGSDWNRGSLGTLHVPKGLFENRWPRRVTRGTAAPCSSLAGGGVSDRAVLRTLAPAGANSATAMRRSMTSMAPVFSVRAWGHPLRPARDMRSPFSNARY